MHFSPEAVPAELPAMIRRFTTIVGWETWEPRLSGLKSQTKINPLWEYFITERYGLELAFDSVHNRLKRTGKCPWPPRTAEEYRLYSFLAMVVRVHDHLSKSARIKLSGAIRSGLEKEFGLGPIAFEMRVAAHLMSRGFDVDFCDLESTKACDLSAVYDSTKIEVECKHISADIGRQIHRQRLYELSTTVFPIIADFIENVCGGFLIETTLPGRLTGNKAQHQEIANCLRAALLNNSIPTANGEAEVSVKTFSLVGTPFSRDQGSSPTMEDAKEYLSEVFGIENANVLIHWRPGRAAVMMYLKSIKEDRVLREIFKRLKVDSKRQFSGDIPAYLCVHLADLTEDQLKNIAETERAGTVTGIQRVVSALLNKRRHLHTIALMTDGSVRISEQTSATTRQTSIREIGPSYVFSKTEHPWGENTVLSSVFK